ncbi:MAG TPA: hemerythrin domain-containing protein [Burkholderiales bacterium]|nr:hemerythrin domain-containing protein [Burkholderiales bacterium]
MDFSRQINRRLHEEHDATLRLCASLEQTLGARPWPPDRANTEVALVLRSAVAALADEVARHFAFEETELFPRLAEAGEGDLAELLAEEHAVIRGIARRLSELHDALRTQTIDAHGWQQLRMHGLELAQRLASHAQMEEMSLLPSVENLLDEDSDRELFSAYVLD